MLVALMVLLWAVSVSCVLVRWGWVVLFPDGFGPCVLVFAARIPCVVLVFVAMVCSLIRCVRLLWHRCIIFVVWFLHVGISAVVVVVVGAIVNREIVLAASVFVVVRFNGLLTQVFNAIVCKWPFWICL